MIGSINTGTKRQIATNYRMETDGDTLLVIFDFKRDIPGGWDIDQITLRYSVKGTEILTGRGNNLPEDGLIGAQLMELAGPLLKEGLFKNLSSIERTQVSDFALNNFSKLTLPTLQELSDHTLIQHYKGHDYKVSFRKHAKSTPNNMDWEIVQIARNKL